MNSILPALTASVSNLQGLPDRYANDASKLYEQQARQSIEQTLPQVLEAMGNRGILNSSTSENAQADAYSKIMAEMANNAYQAKMDAGKMDMAIPAILGQLANLGTASQSQSTGTNTSSSGSTTGSNSANYNITTDPGEPYTRYANILNMLSPYLIGNTGAATTDGTATGGTTTNNLGLVGMPDFNKYDFTPTQIQQMLSTGKIS